MDFLFQALLVLVPSIALKLEVEHGRFPIMYKTGNDTSAIVALLIHGASVHGNDGAPTIELPVWAAEETKPDLIRELRLLAEPAAVRRNLSPSEVAL